MIFAFSSGNANPMAKKNGSRCSGVGAAKRSNSADIISFRSIFPSSTEMHVFSKARAQGCSYRWLSKVACGRLCTTFPLAMTNTFFRRKSESTFPISKKCPGETSTSVLIATTGTSAFGKSGINEAHTPWSSQADGSSLTG